VSIRSGILVSVMKNRNIRFAVAVAVCLGVAPTTFAQTGATMTPFWTGMKDATTFERAMDARLAHAKATLDKMLAVKGARTIDNTLRPYDDVLLELDAVSGAADPKRPCRRRSTADG